MRAREHVARLGNTWGSRCAAGVLKLRHLLLCITKRRAPHSSGTARIPLSETSFNTTHKRIRSNILTLRIRVAGVWSSAIKSGTTPKMRSAEQLSWHNVRNCGTLKWAKKKTENDGRNYKKYAHAKYGLTSTLQFLRYWVWQKLQFVHSTHSTLGTHTRDIYITFIMSPVLGLSFSE